MKKMVIEVWSDIACPYCYLGKKRLEQALRDFPEREQVEIIWKSYQLDPDLKTDRKQGIYEYLEKTRGYDPEQLRRSNHHLSDAGKEIGIDFNFQDIIVANTHKAHVLLQLARTKGHQSTLKDRLMRAYFSEGKNVDDTEVLLSLAEEEGLDREECLRALDGEEWAESVRQDIYEAHQLGARGVPFFVFNDKYIVRGAQEAAVFSGALKKSYDEWASGG